MFFARSASLLVMSKPLSASTVIEVSADRVHRGSASSEPSSSGLAA